MLKFPDWCLSMDCIDCESHAIVSGKLDCNYMNRLGLGQSTVKTFMVDSGSPEKVKAKLDDAKKREKKLKDEIERLEKLKGEQGGEEDGNVSEVQQRTLKPAEE